MSFQWEAAGFNWRGTAFWEKSGTLHNKSFDNFHRRRKTKSNERKQEYSLFVCFAHYISSLTIIFFTCVEILELPQGTENITAARHKGKPYRRRAKSTQSIRSLNEWRQPTRSPLNEMHGTGIPFVLHGLCVFCQRDGRENIGNTTRHASRIHAAKGRKLQIVFHVRFLCYLLFFLYFVIFFVVVYAVIVYYIHCNYARVCVFVSICVLECVRNMNFIVDTLPPLKKSKSFAAEWNSYAVWLNSLSFVVESHSSRLLHFDPWWVQNSKNHPERVMCIFNYE